MRWIMIKGKKAKVALAIASVLILWQVWSYFWVVRDNEVDFSDFALIRGVIAVEVVRASWRSRCWPSVADFTTVWIGSAEGQRIEVGTGRQTGPLEGKGKVYYLKKGRLLWTIIARDEWFSETEPRLPCYRRCRASA